MRVIEGFWKIIATNRDMDNFRDKNIFSRPHQAYVWPDHERSLHLAGYNLNRSRCTKLDLWLVTAGNCSYPLILFSSSRVAKFIVFEGGGRIFKQFIAKLRKAFLFRVPKSFGIFLITFAILKNPFANPLKKVPNLLMEFAIFLS